MGLALSQGIRTFSVGMFFVLAVGAAQAIPLHYSESVSGDLAGSPSTVFSFGIGNNTISGSTYFGVNVPDRPHFDADFDRFAFRLPYGLRLVNISISFTTTSFNTVTALSSFVFCPGVGHCLGNFLGPEEVDFFDASPQQFDFGGALPISAGTYTFSDTGLSIGPVLDPSREEWWSADYIWTLRVTPVPEPGVLSLLGLGLAGLAFTRRRKQ